MSGGTRENRKRTAGTFRFYIHDGVAACRLQLIGELRDEQVSELCGCWGTARTTLGTRKLILDLHSLESVDEAGQQWLAEMAQSGAECVPERYLRDLVAGKHLAGSQERAAQPKPGFIYRLLGWLRGAGVEAVK